jgi:tetratricopeptide (TPR) repeat protein
MSQADKRRGIVIVCGGCRKENEVRLIELTKRDGVVCTGCRRKLEEGQDFPMMHELLDQIIRGASSQRDIDRSLALRLTEQVLEVDNFDARAHHLAGVLHNSEEGSELAVRHLRRAVELDPGRSIYEYDLGVACLYQRKPDEASRCFERAVEILPSYLNALNNLMICYLDLGDFLGALIVADRISTIDRAGRLGDNARKITGVLLDPALPASDSVKAVLNGVTLAFQLERQPDTTPKAAEIFEKCLNVIPETVSSRAFVAAYLADCYLLLDRHEECWRYSQIARRTLPAAAAIIEHPVMNMFEAGMFKDVEAYYKNLVSEMFGVRPGLGIFRGHPQADEKIYMLSTEDDRTFEIRHVGNVVIVTDSDKNEYEHHVYEDEYLSLEGW